MPQVTIKYKKPETLKILKGLAKYLDFQVSVAGTQSAKATSLDDIIIPGNKNLDLTALNEIFTGKVLDAAQLRKSSWER